MIYEITCRKTGHKGKLLIEDELKDFHEEAVEAVKDDIASQCDCLSDCPELVVTQK